MHVIPAEEYDPFFFYDGLGFAHKLCGRKSAAIKMSLFSWNVDVRLIVFRGPGERESAFHILTMVFI